MSNEMISIDESKSEQTKLLIYGFMNMMQTQLFGDQNNNPYYNIPTVIINICIWFYHEIDIFSICGPCLKINAKGDAVTCINNKSRCSVFGLIGIDLNKTNDTIYRWNLKITKFNGKFCLLIGLVSTRSVKYAKRAFDHIDKPDIYFTVDNYADTYCNSSVAVAKNPYWIFREGDVIGMELNTKDRRLSFYVNDINRGIEFSNIDRLVYFLAVSVGGTGDCVVITDFIATYFFDE